MLDSVSCPRSSVWKFNSNLLSDNDFKSEMSSFINAQKQRRANFASLGVWWDDLKLNIRKFCISFSSRKRARMNRERNRLTKCFIHAKSDLALGDNSASTKIRDLESTLYSLISHEMEGAKVQSRAKWVEEGERPTSYFFRLEKKRAEKNFFDCLLHANGVEKTARADMEFILVDFYKNLFAKDALDLQVQASLIDDLEFSLSSSECDSSHSEFSSEELFSALNNLQTGSRLGSRMAFSLSFTLLSGRTSAVFSLLF